MAPYQSLLCYYHDTSKKTKRQLLRFILNLLILTESRCYRSLWFCGEIVRPGMTATTRG